MNLNRAILTFTFVLGMAIPAVAQTKPDVTYAEVPKLNRAVQLGKDQFEARTRLIEETPLGNKYLSFKIRLGKDWEKLASSSQDQGDISKQILGDVTKYLGPPNLDLRSFFRIRANDLPFDVTAKDWFLNYIYSNNYNLQGLDVTSEKRVQAQYVVLENGVQSVVRAVAQISGPRIIFAEYVVPVELWNEERDMAVRGIASFLLQNYDPVPVEVMQTFSFVDIAQFTYPSSWILSAPPVTSIERMSASLTNLKGGGAKGSRRGNANETLLVDGRIDISVVTKGPDVTLAKEVAAIKAQMLEKGLVLGQLIESVKGWPHHEAIIFSRIDVYKLNNSQSRLADYEEWVGLFETPGRYYFVRLLTVGRSDNFYTWSRNVQAFKTVTSSLSPVK